MRTQTKELIQPRSKRYSKTLKYYSMKSIKQKLKSVIYVLLDLAYKRRAVRSTTLRSTTLCGQCQTQSLNWTGVFITFFVIELCPTLPVLRCFQPLANIRSLTQFLIQMLPIIRIGWSSALLYLDIRSLTPAAPQVLPIVGIHFGWRLKSQWYTKMGEVGGICNAGW